MTMREDIEALIKRASTTVWYWDIDKGGLYPAAGLDNENIPSLAESLYEIYRKNKYLPHFNCKAEVSCFSKESWATYGVVLVSTCWTDSKGNIHGVFNYNLGTHIRLRKENN